MRRGALGQFEMEPARPPSRRKTARGRAGSMRFPRSAIRGTRRVRSPERLSALRFTRILMHDVHVAIADPDCRNGRRVVRRNQAGRRSSRRNQIATNHRRSPLGAVVLQLSGRAQNGRMDQNDQSESTGEVLFRLDLERWPGRTRDVEQIRNRRAAERDNSG